MVTPAHHPIPIDLKLLGPPEIRYNGMPIRRLESQKAYGVLYYLCCQPRGASRSELAGLFWGDKMESRGRGNLSRVLHSINGQLPGLLASDRHHVQVLTGESVQLDVQQFQAVAANQDVAAREQALSLLRGGFLEGFQVRNCPEFDLWLNVEREKWRTQHMELLQAGVIHHTEQGAYEAGLAYVDDLLRLEPWREEAHQQKMQLLMMLGRRSAALAQFEQCQRTLLQELGALPSQQTLEMRRRIETDAQVPTILPGASAAAHARRTKLIGRGKEHAQMMRHWEAGRSARGRFTLVQGEAGVGKTALIESVLGFAESSGARIVRGRCLGYRTALPYQALVDGLRPLLEPESGLLNRIEIADTWYTELARLWPTVHAQGAGIHPSAHAEPLVRHRIFEAVTQLLEACLHLEGSLVLFIDDLHDGDQETLDLLRYLFHRLGQRPIWFVAAYRPEETPPGHSLANWRNVLLREQLLTIVSVNALDAAGVGRFLEQTDGPTSVTTHLLAAQKRTALARFLWTVSEGNPYLLEQYLATASDYGVLLDIGGQTRLDLEKLADLASDPPLPAGVEALHESRLARLNARARRLLQVAGVIGRDFSIQHLQAVSSEPIEWVEVCLSNWLGRKLVEEVAGGDSEPAYRFTHASLWQTVLNELSAGQRQRLRGRIHSVETGQTPQGTMRRRGSAVIEEILPPQIMENLPEELDVW